MVAMSVGNKKQTLNIVQLLAFGNNRLAIVKEKRKSSFTDFLDNHLVQFVVTSAKSDHDKWFHAPT